MSCEQQHFHRQHEPEIRGLGCEVAPAVPVQLVRPRERAIGTAPIKILQEIVQHARETARVVRPVQRRQRRMSGRVVTLLVERHLEAGVELFGVARAAVDRRHRQLREPRRSEPSRAAAGIDSMMA
jgi:hypothetical protein